MLTAADELNRGLFDAAKSRLSRADGQSASVPEERRTGFEITLALVRLSLASERGDLPRAKEQAGLLLASIEDGDRAGPGVGDARRTLALISLGSAELWSAQHGFGDVPGILRDAAGHLAEGVALAHLVGRPYLEVDGLTHLAMATFLLCTFLQSDTSGAEHALRAVKLARQHGWGDEPVVALAYLVLGMTTGWQGQLEEAESWFAIAERTIPTPAQPGVRLWLYIARGWLEAALGRNEGAWAAYKSAVQTGRLL